MKTSGRRIAATLLTCLFGIATMSWGTDGFSAYTAESARRLEILRSPRPLPAAVLEDQDGRSFALQDYAGRLLAVEFIYTRCRTVCSSLGAAFRQIRDRLPESSMGQDFALLSISFDPLHDNPAQLRAYAANFGADGAYWRIARVRSEAELLPLLKAFGVVVIPDGLGGFEHNAAIHLVGRDGRLQQISDLDAVTPFVGTIRAAL